MEPAISLTTTSDEIAAVIALAQAAEGFKDVSEPSDLDAGRLLNCGLTADDFQTVLQIVTTAFNSGTSLLAFLTALRATMGSRSGAVGVSDPDSGKPLGRIDAGTVDSALARLVPL